MPPSGSANLSNFWFWVALLIGAIILGALAVSMIRKHMFEADTEADGATPFTLHDLRRLRESGQLSEEEFEKARAIILGNAASRKPPPSTSDPSSTTLS